METAKQDEAAARAAAKAGLCPAPTVILRRPKYSMFATRAKFLRARERKRIRSINLGDFSVSCCLAARYVVCDYRTEIPAPHETCRKHVSHCPSTKSAAGPEPSTVG